MDTQSGKEQGGRPDKDAQQVKNPKPARMVALQRDGRGRIFEPVLDTGVHMEPAFWILTPPPLERGGRLWVEVRYGDPETNSLLPAELEAGLVRARVWAERAHELDTETLRLSLNAQRQLGFYVSAERLPIALGLYYDLGYHLSSEGLPLYVHCYAQGVVLGAEAYPTRVPAAHLTLRLLPESWPAAERPWPLRVEFFGRPQPGAEVELIRPRCWKGQTDHEGWFEIPALEVGTCALRVTVRVPRSGTVRGQPYQAVEHRATLYLPVQEG